MRKPMAAIDFDGTIVKHKFPNIGEPLEDAFEVMKELKEAGWVLILSTCREDEGYKIERQFLKNAVDFCRENGIEFDGVNETPQECEFRPDGGRKVYADVYIDDRNLGGFPGWAAVRKELLR
jgi:predicted mannosyl-3-phosphoglycerate phosphatase (HAD superfamily)